MKYTIIAALLLLALGCKKGGEGDVNPVPPVVVTPTTPTLMTVSATSSQKELNDALKQAMEVLTSRKLGEPVVTPYPAWTPNVVTLELVLQAQALVKGGYKPTLFDGSNRWKTDYFNCLVGQAYGLVYDDTKTAYVNVSFNKYLTDQDPTFLNVRYPVKAQ